MIRDALQQIVTAAVDQLVQSNQLPEAVRSVRIEITDTKQPEHGDFACNFALAASKAAGMNPRQLGEILAEGIMESGKEVINAVEIAGPGFLNFRLNPGWVASFIPQVLSLGSSLPNAQSSTPNAQKINVEFVSVNPNGPITIGSGRGAAYGSTLCNVLEAAGNKVHREYYINDGVNSQQMRLFAESVKAAYFGEPIPENGYKGEYIFEVAERIKSAVRGVHDQHIEFWEQSGKSLNLADLEAAAMSGNIDWYQSVSQANMLALQKLALTKFGTEFDTWFSEQSLHDSGLVAEEMVQMTASQVADDREIRTVLKLAKGGVIDDVILENQAGKAEVDDDVHGEGAEEDQAKPSNQATEQPSNSKTLWLRSAKFGDDMDRVLKRRDGRLTYIASDVAYHKDKLTDASGVRGTGPVDKMITVLGPDHHGYIGRLQAVVAAMLKAEGLVAGEKGSGGAEEQPLSEIDAKIYSSPEERDLCKAALAEAKQKLEVQIFQLVRFVKDGKPAPMRKRDGNIYALIDLMREIGENVKPNGTEEEKLEAGKDVARFFYLMRSHDTTFDFDLDLAQKQSDENPVFYVQYAHARICSVIAKAEGTEGIKELGKEEIEHSLLTHERELTLIRKICDLPYEVQRCAEDYGVHRLATYAIELARTYHHFYDACRVIQPEDSKLTRARLALCEATRTALKATLDLLEISAPQRMERAEQQVVAADL